jgi:hypothetical protein
MQDALGQLDTPSHSPGENFDDIGATVCQPESLENFRRALPQICAPQAVRCPWWRRFSMTVNLRSKALRLKHNAGNASH